jgi:hypothetical protein
MERMKNSLPSFSSSKISLIQRKKKNHIFLWFSFFICFFYGPSPNMYIKIDLDFLDCTDRLLFVR